MIVLGVGILLYVLSDPDAVAWALKSLILKACLPTWVFVMSDANGTGYTREQTKT